MERTYVRLSLGGDRVDLGLKGRRALMTAASKGLGRACAAAVAAEGARVFISARGEEALASTAREIGAEGHLACDLADPAVPDRLVAAAVEKLGGLDILYVNAGGPPPGFFTTMSLEDWDRGYQLTLMSAVRLLKAALPHLERSDQARVVISSSTSVKQPIPDLVASNAFRSALTAAARSLANEVAARGITVNTLAPGRIETDRILQIDEAASKREGISREEVTERSKKVIPMGRLGRPDEFGAVCAFLCSAQASYVTGQLIVVDGGQTRSTY